MLLLDDRPMIASKSSPASDRSAKTKSESSGGIGRENHGRADGFPQQIIYRLLLHHHSYDTKYKKGMRTLYEIVALNALA